MSTNPTPDALTDGNPHIERARLIKATKIAERIESLFGTSCEPTNEAVRIAAAILATEGEIADRPQSDTTCEIVRVILSTRNAIFQFADTNAEAIARRARREADQLAADAAEGRALLEGM